MIIYSITLSLEVFTIFQRIFSSSFKRYTCSSRIPLSSSMSSHVLS
nr:MAG TPA_asm: hypothetical protein [Caudoviricetes sp.]